MTLREFVKLHPAEAIDVISTEGYAYLSAKRTLVLARGQPDDLKLLDWDISYKDFSGGAWHVMTVAPALEEGTPDMKLAMA